MSNTTNEKLLKYIKINTSDLFADISPMIGDIRDLQGQIVLIETLVGFTKIDGLNYSSEYVLSDCEKSYVDEVSKSIDYTVDEFKLKDHLGVYHLYNWKDKIFAASKTEEGLKASVQEIIDNRTIKNREWL